MYDIVFNTVIRTSNIDIGDYFCTKCNDFTEMKDNKCTCCGSHLSNIELFDVSEKHLGSCSKCHNGNIMFKDWGYVYKACHYIGSTMLRQGYKANYRADGICSSCNSKYIINIAIHRIKENEIIIYIDSIEKV